MTGAFVIAAGLIVAVTLALLLWPFLRRGPETVTASHRQLNAAIYRDQFAELERDRAEGTLSEEDFQQARTELQRRVLDDGRDDEAPAVARAPKKTMWALALLLPVAAVALYLLLGNIAGLKPPVPEHRFSSAEIERMVAGLAAKLEREPNNLQGWMMLARSYKMMQRIPEAAKAYEHAAALPGADSQLFADYADVAAVLANGSFEGKPSLLLEKALKLDPNNLQARWLAGTAAFQRGDFAKAIAEWEWLLKQVPPESEDAQVLKESINQARAQAGMAKAANAAKNKAP